MMLFVRLIENRVTHIAGIAIKDQPGGCYLTTAEELGFQTLVIVETARESGGEIDKAVSGNVFPRGNKTQSGIYEKGD